MHPYVISVFGNIHFEIHKCEVIFIFSMLFYAFNDNASLCVQSLLFQLTISTHNKNRVATFLGGYCCHLKQMSPEIVSVANYFGIPYITDKYRK